MKKVILLILVNSVAGRTAQELREDYVKGCGKPYKIESGTSVVQGQQPWHVAILHSDSMECEGVLVTEKFVLTAALCVNGTRNSLLGAELGRDERDGSPKEHRRIRRKIVHENFTCISSSCIYDIALIELAEPVRYRKHIVPACLPGKNQNFVGVSALASRWSHWTRQSPHFLHPEKSNAPVLPDEDCETPEDIARHLSPHLNISITELRLCVHIDNLRMHHLLGGSPLLLELGGRAHIIGLHSTRALRGTENWYYTNVSYFTEWINTRISMYSSSEDRDVKEADSAMTLIELEDRLERLVSTIIAVAVLLVFALAVLCGVLLMLVRYRKLTDQLRHDLDIASQEEPGSYLQTEQP